MTCEPDKMRTIGFVDLAGFTALTEAHGDFEAANLIGRFCELASRCADSDASDEIVKSMGDAVMTASISPVQGINLVTAIVQACYDEPRFPVPRAGLHHGPVERRGGDYFGSTVNIAARVAAQASGSQLLATTAVIEGVGVDADAWADIGSLSLRNVREPVRLYQLQTDRYVDDGSIDPVCRMLVSPRSSAGRLRHGHIDYWFCSLECAGRFATDPGSYAS